MNGQREERAARALPGKRKNDRAGLRGWR